MKQRRPQKVKLDPKNRNKYVDMKIAYANLEKELLQSIATDDRIKVEKIEKTINDKADIEKQIVKAKSDIHRKDLLLKSKPKLKEKPIMKEIEKDKPYSQKQAESFSPITYEDLLMAGVPAEKIEGMKKAGFDPKKSEFSGISHEPEDMKGE